MVYGAVLPEGGNLNFLIWGGGGLGWSHMKRKVKAESHSTTSLPKLMSIKTMWVTDMPHNYFLNLAHTMPKRIRDVLVNQGQMTKY
jgi:hypothetical protein